MLNSYYTECDLKKCYSCRKEADQAKIRLEIKCKKLEESRIKKYQQTQLVNMQTFGYIHENLPSSQPTPLDPATLEVSPDPIVPRN